MTKHKGSAQPQPCPDGQKKDSLVEPGDCPFGQGLAGGCSVARNKKAETCLV